MRYLIIILFIFPSCIFKLNKNLTAKGYNLSRDTVSFHPYEYVIKQKSYTPIYEVCNFENKLHVKISIKGYENVDTIPFSALKGDLQISLNDSSIKMIANGKMHIQFHGGGYMYSFKNTPVANFHINLPILSRIKPDRTAYPNCILYFFCIIISKQDSLFAIPSRNYFINMKG